MEGTVCNQITEDDTNNNIGNIDNLSIKYIIINLLTHLSCIHPISFIISTLVIIYSVCLIYSLFSLNRDILTPL
jgi:hypothetical protein